MIVVQYKNLQIDIGKHCYQNLFSFYQFLHALLRVLRMCVCVVFMQVGDTCINLACIFLCLINEIDFMHDVRWRFSLFSPKWITNYSSIIFLNSPSLSPLMCYAFSHKNQVSPSV